MTATYLHSLPRQLGAKTFIVWFLLSCAEQEGIAPIGRKWMLDHMPEQTSPNTVTAALRYLCDPENQIAVRVTGGWRLATATQLPLELSTAPVDNSTQKRAERAFGSSSSSSNRKEKEFLEEEEEQESEKRAERAFHPNFKENHKLLRAHGVGEPKATQLAGLRHVTPEFITAHFANIQDTTLTVGTAIHRIEHQWTPDPNLLPPPPPKPKNSTDIRRYTEGEFAEYINS